LLTNYVLKHYQNGLIVGAPMSPLSESFII
jgi:hypothetical protein